MTVAAARHNVPAKAVDMDAPLTMRGSQSVPNRTVGRGDSARRLLGLQVPGEAVVCATGDDVPVLAALLAHDLWAGSLGAWLVPDAAVRARALHRYAEFVLIYGVRHGRVDTTEDRAAVAVWFSRPDPPPLAGAGWVGELRGLLGPFAARFAVLHAVAPRTPHHYLAQFAAGPGQGAAGALLAGCHRVVDAEGLPAYTQVCGSEPRESLFSQLGYLPRSPMLLESGGPVLWRMHRPGRGGVRRDGLPRRVRLHQAAAPSAGAGPSAVPPLLGRVDTT
ncbi:MULTISPECIES: N-acetyltransferase [unclassified Micromonospora]|uniref:N-acetyltransferase n=1 Tax=unclassified Micromonospora TaxID=2617518 RepID=UPI0020B1D05A|nr:MULTISPECIES: N-acetyltransferase [unclassified Micromonospora]MDM4783314.1 N-acetyltransferase [Micromonospora sp. b486]